MRNFNRGFRPTQPNIGLHCGNRTLKSWVLKDWPIILYLFVFVVVPYIIILFLFIFSIVSKLT